MKDRIGKAVLYVGLAFVVILCIPLMLLYLLFKLLATPFDYAKYKRSRYQKDFPHKYAWLRDPHIDNEPYTAIKENDFPVEYIKWSDDYDFAGYFVYKDVLLDFTEPFFFDEEQKLFLCLPEDKEAEEVSYNDEGEDAACKSADGKGDGNDARLTVEGVKELIFDGFRVSVPNRECNKIVFFYSHRNAKRNFGEEGLNVMRGLDGFIIYEKGELAKAIKEFIDNN